MIYTIYRDQSGQVQTGLPPETFSRILQDPHGLFWLDLSGEPLEVCEPILRDVFDFHQLAVDDALREIHVPKIDDWENYLYMVLPAILRSSSETEIFTPVELDIFLGTNYLVTYHDKPIPALVSLEETCLRDERLLSRGAAYLVYRLADEFVDDVMPVVEEVEERIDQIEDRIFQNPQPATLEELFTIRRALLQLRRLFIPQREVFNKLSRGDYAVINTKHRIFFRDVYDHLVRLQDINENLRDLTSSALETYLSVVNNKMNDVMKTLTAITTIFMPVSFLAGFFGMNFFQPVLHLDAWTGDIAFLLMLIATLLIPLAMFIWVKRRGWI
ncbi:MAG: magnesium/cobalt transporter CorA [Chloroflexota bacterium]